MGQDAVNGILEALKGAQQRRVEKTRLAIDQQKANNEDEYRKAEIANAKSAHDEVAAQHKTENAHWDALNQAAVASRKLSQAKELQEMGERSNASGIPIPGATVQSPIASIPGALGVSTPGSQTFEGTQIPYDPAAYRQKQLDFADQTEGPDSPKAKAKMAESVALQNAMQDRLIEQNRQNRQAAQDLQDNKNDAAMLRTRFAQGQENYRAGLKLNQATDNFDPNPHVAGALNGTESQDEINKLPKDQKALVIDQLSKIGGKAPTAKQLQFIQSLGGAVSAIPDMEQYNQLVNGSDSGTSMAARIGLGSDTYNKRINLEKSIGEKLVQATNGMIPGVSRLSQPRIAAMQDAYQPTVNPIHSAGNPGKLAGYVKNLNDVIDTELSNLPPAQRQHLKEQSGLAPFVDKYVHPQVQAQPKSQQSPTQSQPIQPNQASPGLSQMFQKYGIQQQPQQ